ncbi:hypothetical protein [Bacillus andreraoultii]|uniref:hypothetical protein n=1 Tax=Bacillus andreraoultii TaxID=1499685 RepID=UPI000539A4FB|nr:hypothetical protein [Bacillus andreraoultii]
MYGHLFRLRELGLVIDTVYTLPINDGNETVLHGVKVTEMTPSYVTFTRATSAEASHTTIAIKSIVAIDHPPLPPVRF